MLKARFTGRVLPKVLRVSTGPLDRIERTIPDLDLTLAFSIRVQSGIVEVNCDLSRYEPSLLGELYKRALDLTRAAVDLLAFATGQGLVVVLEHFTDPAGRRMPLTFDNGSLAPLCTAFRIATAGDTSFSEVSRLVMADPNMFMALNDLIAAITYPHQAPVNCARAMEAVRNCITPPAKQREQPDKAWARMHQALCVDKKYLQDITEPSKGPRHGNREFIPGPQITAIVEKSWRVMDRFLEYRKRGDKDLPQSEFATLTAP